jgi:hypothetical protein
VVGIAVGFKSSFTGVKKPVTGDVKTIMVMKIILIFIIIITIIITKYVIKRIYLKKGRKGSGLLLNEAT